MSESAENSATDSQQNLGLWAGLLIAPIGWFASLQINYMAVAQHCAPGGRFVLPLTTVAALILVGSGGALAWRCWRQSGRTWPTDMEGAPSRRRFLAVLGLFTSSLFALAVIAQAIPGLVLQPCQL